MCATENRDKVIRGLHALARAQASAHESLAYVALDQNKALLALINAANAAEAAARTLREVADLAKFEAEFLPWWERLADLCNAQGYLDPGFGHARDMYRRKLTPEEALSECPLDD